ncbi:hypothetical protein [Aquabacter spiritensis]|uniref:Uncharacterized protein n=1 Tax=Aquabacter spiritensis TaxID=933073 RepID=A0A4R3M4K6_9HYPH|nr:hypothetical protein [Aquabacter spiritensis]TCT08180.1 hypothetical protein EDC64_101702 [Aquabacter spiritensis]
MTSADSRFAEPGTSEKTPSEPKLIDLIALSLAGIALTGAVLAFAPPAAFIAPAGTPGFSAAAVLEEAPADRTAAVPAPVRTTF